MRSSRSRLGGAHRDPTAMAASLKAALIRHLDALEAVPRDELRAARAARSPPSGCSQKTRPRAWLRARRDGSFGPRG